MGNKKKKEKKPDKKIMKIKKEKINRHCTSEEYRVCITFYITFILTHVTLIARSMFSFHNAVFLERTVCGGRMG